MPAKKKTNSSIRPLKADLLRVECDPSQFDFKTTADLKDLKEIVGQARALEAVRFGVGIRHQGYNLYALGPPGIGKHTVICNILDKEAVKRPPGSDWCYLHNFENPQEPIAIELPTGMGKALHLDMQHLLEDLLATLPATFESDAFRARMQTIDDDFKDLQTKRFKELETTADQQGMVILSTPHGFAVAPIEHEQVLTTEDFEKLPEKEREEKEAVINVLRTQLSDFIEQIPRWQKEKNQKKREVEEAFTLHVVGQMITELKGKYSDLKMVCSYLDAVQVDVINNVADFRPREEREMVMLGQQPDERPTFTRYKVNVLVNNSKKEGAPVIYEDNPNYANLIGRIEHLAQFGTLTTDFTLIRAGALHRANHGYLVLDINKVLNHPHAWDGLKRALQAQKVVIEPLGQMLGMMGTVTLEPGPIDLDLKVILLGERMFYYLLCELDPEFNELFKVAADFEEQMPRSDKNHELYARLIGTLIRKEKLRHFHCDAVARVIDQSARIVGDSERLTMHMRSVTDLLREAEYWAAQGKCKLVRAEHVQQAIEAQVYRQDRMRKVVYEEINRGTIFIDSSGAMVGQVNGLSVLQMGDFSFGQPSRLTATTRAGGGEVVDIEREVELGGALHSKGVLIISGFLKGRYAKKHMLSLSASLVFEQSYGEIEGDSASIGELCALLSALANVPIKQSLAVTGSVNQHGQVQPIGGVNEKIEGFFDVCKQRGLVKGQGVIIPKANIKHLMLRHDVVQAVRDKKFAVYAVSDVDEAIQLLTGEEPGKLNQRGSFPRGSLNYRVEKRLEQYALISEEGTKAKLGKKAKKSTKR